MRFRTALGMLAVTALALLFASAGCGEDESAGSTSGDAEEQLCSDLDEFRQALAGIQDVSLNSSADDLTQLRDNIENSLDAVRISAADVADARTEDLEQAYDDLTQSIEGISEAATIGDAFTEVLDAAATVGTALQDVFSRLGCST